jgi:hypothetical protein
MKTTKSISSLRCLFCGLVPYISQTAQQIKPSYWNVLWIINSGYNDESLFSHSSPILHFLLLQWLETCLWLQCMINRIVYRQEKKKLLFFVFPSHKIIVQKYLLIRSSVTPNDVQLGGVGPSWAQQMCRFDCQYPPHLHMVDHLICGKSYIYWLLRNNSSPVSLPLCLVTHWFSPQLHLPSSSYPEKGHVLLL